MLKYNEIQKLLSGTKLSGLTDNQIEEAIIGQYPLSHSSKEIERLYHSILKQADEGWKLKYLEIDLLLDGMLNKVLTAKISLDKTNEQIEKIEAIRGYLNESYKNRIDLEFLKGMINESNLLLSSYESKLRSKDLEIKNLKENIK